MGTDSHTAVEITHPLQYSFQKKKWVLDLSPNQHQAESQGLS